jgi:hypothetical protein
MLIGCRIHEAPVIRELPTSVIPTAERRSGATKRKLRPSVSANRTKHSWRLITGFTGNWELGTENWELATGNWQLGYTRNNV